MKISEIPEETYLSIRREMLLMLAELYEEKSKIKYLNPDISTESISSHQVYVMPVSKEDRAKKTDTEKQESVHWQTLYTEQEGSEVTRRFISGKSGIGKTSLLLRIAATILRQMANEEELTWPQFEWLIYIDASQLSYYQQLNPNSQLTATNILYDLYFSELEAKFNKDCIEAVIKRILQDTSRTVVLIDGLDAAQTDTKLADKCHSRLYEFNHTIVTGCENKYRNYTTYQSFRMAGLTLQQQQDNIRNYCESHVTYRLNSQKPQSGTHSLLAEKLGKQEETSLAEEIADYTTRMLKVFSKNERLYTGTPRMLDMFCLLTSMRLDGNHKTELPLNQTQCLITAIKPYFRNFQVDGEQGIADMSVAQGQIGQAEDIDSEALVNHRFNNNRLWHFLIAVGRLARYSAVFSIDQLNAIIEDLAKQYPQLFPQDGSNAIAHMNQLLNNHFITIVNAEKKLYRFQHLLIEQLFTAWGYYIDLSAEKMDAQTDKDFSRFRQNLNSSNRPTTQYLRVLIFIVGFINGDEQVYSKLCSLLRHKKFHTRAGYTSNDLYIALIEGFGRHQCDFIQKIQAQWLEVQERDMIGYCQWSRPTIFNECKSAATLLINHLYSYLLKTRNEDLLRRAMPYIARMNSNAIKMTLPALLKHKGEKTKYADKVAENILDSLPEEELRQSSIEWMNKLLASDVEEDILLGCKLIACVEKDILVVPSVQKNIIACLLNQKEKIRKIVIEYLQNNTESVHFFQVADTLLVGKDDSDESISTDCLSLLRYYYDCFPEQVSEALSARNNPSLLNIIDQFNQEQDPNIPRLPAVLAIEAQLRKHQQRIEKEKYTRKREGDLEQDDPVNVGIGTDIEKDASQEQSVSRRTEAVSNVDRGSPDEKGEGSGSTLESAELIGNPVQSEQRQRNKKRRGHKRKSYEQRDKSEQRKKDILGKEDCDEVDNHHDEENIGSKQTKNTCDLSDESKKKRISKKTKKQRLVGKWIRKKQESQESPQPQKGESSQKRPFDEVAGEISKRRKVMGYSARYPAAENVTVEEIRILINPETELMCYVCTPAVATDETELNTIIRLPGTAGKQFVDKAEYVMASHIASETGCRVIVPCHRLAPENKWVLIHNDVVAIVRILLSKHSPFNTRCFMLSAYSAGTLIAMQLGLRAMKHGKSPFVGGIHLDAPVFDISVNTNLKPDPDPKRRKKQFPVELFRGFAGIYLSPGMDPKSPSVSSQYIPREYYENKDGIVYIVIGELDVRIEHVRKFKDELMAAGLTVIYKEIKECKDCPGCEVCKNGPPNHGLPWNSPTFIKVIAGDIKQRFQEVDPVTDFDLPEFMPLFTNEVHIWSDLAKHYNTHNALTCLDAELTANQPMQALELNLEYMAASSSASVQCEAIKWQDLFQDNYQRYVISAEVGAGKTSLFNTITSHLLQRLANPDEMEDSNNVWPQFTGVIHIKLRDLSRYKGKQFKQDFSLRDVIFDIFFKGILDSNYQLCNDQYVERVITQMLDNSEKTVLLLDGYGELSGDSVCQAIYKEFVKIFPHHLVSGRAEALKAFNRRADYGKVAIQPLITQQKEDYIQRYCKKLVALEEGCDEEKLANLFVDESELSDTELKRKQKLSEYCQSMQTLLEKKRLFPTQSPLNLDIFCHVASDIVAGEKIDEQRLSNPAQWYRAVVMKTIGRYYKKCFNKTLSYLEWDKNYLNNKALVFLIAVAKKMQLNPVIDKQMIRVVVRELREQYPHLFTKKDSRQLIRSKGLLACGLLRCVDPVRMTYEFQHLSIQEFLFAWSLFIDLKSNELARIQKFIQQYKFNTRYAVIWMMLTGLLAEAPELQFQFMQLWQLSQYIAANQSDEANPDLVILEGLGEHASELVKAQQNAWVENQLQHILSLEYWIPPRSLACSSYMLDKFILACKAKIVSVSSDQQQAILSAVQHIGPTAVKLISATINEFIKSSITPIEVRKIAQQAILCIDPVEAQKQLLDEVLKRLKSHENSEIIIALQLINHSENSLLQNKKVITSLLDCLHYTASNLEVTVKRFLMKNIDLIKRPTTDEKLLELTNVEDKHTVLAALSLIEAYGHDASDAMIARLKTLQNHKQDEIAEKSTVALCGMGERVVTSEFVKAHVDGITSEKYYVRKKHIKAVEKLAEHLDMAHVQQQLMQCLASKDSNMKNDICKLISCLSKKLIPSQALTLQLMENTQERDWTVARDAKHAIASLAETRYQDPHFIQAMLESIQDIKISRRGKALESENDLKQLLSTDAKQRKQAQEHLGLAKSQVARLTITGNVTRNIGGRKVVMPQGTYHYHSMQQTSDGLVIHHALPSQAGPGQS